MDDRPVDIDPRLREEARAANERLRSLFGPVRIPHRSDLPHIRRVRAEGGDGFPPPDRDPSATEASFPAPAGPLRARVLRPAGARPVTGALLYVPGGGWSTGGCDLQDGLLRGTVDATGMAAVAIEHRLAPEQPYPAPVDDVAAALGWFPAWARAELGADRLALAGDSTGAHLALTALLGADDRVVGAYDAVDLTNGIYDLGLTAGARRWGSDNLLLSTPLLEWYVGLFTPGLDRVARRHPSISPLFADESNLRRLPPTLLSVGEADPLLDDTVLLARRLRAAGVTAEVARYPDAHHAFFLDGHPYAEIALARRAGFLQRHLSRG